MEGVVKIVCFIVILVIGEVIPKSSEDEESKIASADELELQPNQRISSPIRLTPERREGSGRGRRRPAADSGTRGGENRGRDDDKKPRLPVRDRLYLNKTEIGMGKYHNLETKQHNLGRCSRYPPSFAVLIIVY